MISLLLRVLRQRSGLAAVTCALIVLASCQSAPSQPVDAVSESTIPTVAAPVLTGTPSEIASALISAERAAAIEGNTPLLETLWAPEARIIDGRGTDTAADDYIWQGRNAILDRYILAVFPAPPPSITDGHFDALRITSPKDDVISAELGVDRWTFTRSGDRWYLQELRYN